jgi:hypothetical protein
MPSLPLISLILGCPSPTDTSDKTDNDNDGYFAEIDDCDDERADINPGAIEQCDDIDHDCDGKVDNDIQNIDWFEDGDDDGFGNLMSSVNDCRQPSGFVDNSDDCDDTNLNINPNAEEICDGIDNDCDSDIDDDDTSVTGQGTWYQDADNDSFGNPAISQLQCASSLGYVSNQDDCDDTNPNINPTANEVCDGNDNDCDGYVDNNPVDGSFWYEDVDEDGYGECTSYVLSCSNVDGYVDNPDDCDDSNVDVNPDADEVCEDGIDNDCDNGLNACWWGSDNLEDTTYPFQGGSITNWFAGTSVSGLGAWDTSSGYGYDWVGTGFPGDLDDVQGWFIMREGQPEIWTGTDRNHFTIKDATNGDGIGSSIASQEDINGDGNIDVATGLIGYDDSTDGNEGALCLITTMKNDLVSIPGRTFYTNYACDTLLVGSEIDGQLGKPSLFIEDQDSDGVAEILAGSYNKTAATGAVYLITGSSDFKKTDSDSDGNLVEEEATIEYVDDVSSIAFTHDDVDSLFENEDGFEHPALSLAKGDINGSGTDDLIIGVPADAAGLVTVFEGASTSVTGSSDIDLTSTTPTDATFFTGANLSDGLGHAVYACDLDGDGYDDVIMGAPLDSTNQTEAGQVAIMYGSTTFITGKTQDFGSVSPDATIDGTEEYGNLGYAVTGDDFNLSGYCDLVMSFPSIDNTASQTGLAIVWGGGKILSGVNDQTDADDFLFADDTSIGIGLALSPCGNIEDPSTSVEGYPDLCVGTPFYNNGHTNEGAAWSIYGQGF